MDFGNDLALVALVISLIALGIAAGQILQQYFGTADGYRHCQNSVMGPWSKYTRLRFRWSEMRFETRFTTPEIQLLMKDEMIRLEDIHPEWSWEKRGYKTRINRRQHDQYQARVDSDLEQVPVETILGPFQHKSDLLDFDITDDTVSVPEPLRTTVKISRQTRTRGTDLVTWTRLLRSLHQYQVGVGHSKAIGSKEKSLSVSGDARVVVRMNEWSWDLVPPDLVRPYATSTIGCFVNLAHRLGMQWQTLEPSKGDISAEGHGHYISCTSIRGLGIVLQYSYNSRLDPKEKYTSVPTHAADKLRCGIIPAGELGTGEHSLIGANKEHTSAADVFRNLGVSRAAQAALTDLESLRSMRRGASSIRHAYNDMICLLSPWLPLPDDWRRAIAWPVRTSGLNCPLFFWEGRKTLLQRLQQYVIDKALNADDLASKVLRHI